MRIEAPAKLNLCLFLGLRREDGLHELCSLFEPLPLTDVLEGSQPVGGGRAEGGWAGGGGERDEAVGGGVGGAAGETLAAGALAALREGGWERPPLRVEIEKRIPVA